MCKRLDVGARQICKLMFNLLWLICLATLWQTEDCKESITGLDLKTNT